nr:EOG090X08GG [Lepidurus arcticus]
MTRAVPTRGLLSRKWPTKKRKKQCLALLLPKKLVSFSNVTENGNQHWLNFVNFTFQSMCKSFIIINDCRTKILSKNVNQVLFLVIVHKKAWDKRTYESFFEGWLVLVHDNAHITLRDLLFCEFSFVSLYLLEFFIGAKMPYSHRPIDVCNIYNDGQIRLLMTPKPADHIPEFKEIFDQDSDNEAEANQSDEDLFEDSDSEEAAGRRRKKQRFDEEAILKRRDKRIWEEKRLKILFEYTQFSFYGESASFPNFMKLAWRLSRETNDLLWWAITGLTEQQLLGKIEGDDFLLSCGKLQSHVVRLAVPGDDDGTWAKECLRIVYEKDINLLLYRHWNLYESLRHTPITACHFKLWTLQGEKRLSEFLADMGLPLVQCRQKFSSMDMDLRTEVKTLLETKAGKYGLESKSGPNSVIDAAFVAQDGYKKKYTATDAALATLALLESPNEKFMAAMDSLSKTNRDLMEKGLETARFQLTAIFKSVQTMLSIGQVLSAGPFLYAVFQEGSPDQRFFGSPHTLLLLCRFLLKAHVASSKNRKAPYLPLLISAPIPDTDSCLVLGIPPLAEESPRNLFGKAFEQAAEKTQSEMSAFYFDTSVIRLKTENRSKFFDALTSMLS